jgi:hypothetical protein
VSPIHRRCTHPFGSSTSDPSASAFTIVNAFSDRGTGTTIGRAPVEWQYLDGKKVKGSPPNRVIRAPKVAPPSPSVGVTRMMFT